MNVAHGSETFSSRCQIRFRCKRDDTMTYADLHASSVRKITLNGRPLDGSGVDRGRLHLPTLAGENTLVVEAEFGYACADEGLNRISAADGGVGVYSKPNQGGAPRMFCCFDEPDLRAPFTVSVRAPAGWACVANGEVVTRPTDDGSWRFAATTMAPYQFGVCAGSFRGPTFVCARTDGSELPVTVWGTAGSAALREPHAVAELVRQPLRYYERALDVPYPFAKCDLVFIPAFPALGFSAPGLIAIRDDVLEAGAGKPALYVETVIAHELAHVWIGGLTDIRRHEMWLQEALTTYLSRIALSEIGSVISPWATSESAALPDHAYADDADKVRQLERLIGREAVMRGLGRLLDRHAHGTTTKDELVKSWSDVGGRDLRAWAAATLIPTQPTAVAEPGSASVVD